MKRFLPLFLAVLLLLSACGGGADAPSSAGTAAAETTAATEAATEPPLSDDVPALDFKGAHFRFMTILPKSVQHVYMTVHEQTGDVLNDAMYNNTAAVEARYNIVFEEDYAAKDFTTMGEQLAAAVLAGDDTYDAATPKERTGFAMTSGGYFKDMKDIPHFNFEKPYWFKDVNEAINFSKHTYLAYGSAVLTYYDYLHVLVFNKQMISDLKLDDPYKLVLDGTWTYDKFKSMASAAVADKDGDGAWGTGDVYGIVGTTRSLPGDFFAASGHKVITTDGGDVKVNLLTDPEIEKIFSTILADFWQPGFWYTKSTDINNYFLKDTYFQTNQALFAEHTFFTMFYLREMESDYGIIPYPKWKADQDFYGTMIEAGGNVLAIPKTTKDPAMVGAVIETMNFLSYENVVPAYYENVLKGKYSRDSVSAQMLDIILDSVIYDLSNTMFCDYVVGKITQPLFQNNRTDYVSTVTSVMPTIDKAIADAKGA